MSEFDWTTVAMGIATLSAWGLFLLVGALASLRG